MVQKTREDFLQSILKWNTIWFKNPDNNDPPQLCQEQLRQLKLSYSSVDEYIEYYKPLVLNEIWTQICERVESIKKNKPFKVQLFIHTYEAEDDFLVLTCVLPITIENLKTNNYPTEGDLIVTEIAFEKNGVSSGNDKKVCDNKLVLGYVSEFVVDEITEKTMLNKNIPIPSTCKKLLRYIIKLKSMTVKIDLSKPLRCSSIYYLKPKLKQCEALTNLDRSSLYEGIINPDRKLVSIQLNPLLKDDGIYNTCQLNVIHNSNNLVNSSQPGILLIQGPPGEIKLLSLFLEF